MAVVMYRLTIAGGSILGLLRKRATAISFTLVLVIPGTARGTQVLQFEKKIRSVSHFLEPPAINKSPSQMQKRYVNQIL